MRKWLKRSMLGVALLMALGGMFLTGGFVLLHGRPDYYRASLLSALQRADAAARAESKLSQMQNLAVDAHGAEIQRARGVTQPTTLPGLRTFSFTDDELNALFNKWAELHGWKELLAHVVEDPLVVLQEGRIILAGKVSLKNFDTIVSIHFIPRITADGQLDLKLDSILGGKLPLPRDTVISPARGKILSQLAAALPQMQQRAGLSPEGAANEDAVKALFSEMLLNTLNDHPSPPAICLPLFSKGNGMAPFKVTEVSVAAGALTFSVLPMTAAERAALLDQIKKPIEFDEITPR